MSMEATGISVTATPHFQGQYLIVRRSLSDPYLPGVWAYPGGRVHYEMRDVLRPDGSVKSKAFSETLTEAAAREVFEETGLRATRAFYVDSYPSLGDRAAAHFCVDVVAPDVEIDPSELMDYRWITSLEQQQELVPRIDGLDNHLARILAEMRGEYVGPYRELTDLDLVDSRYINLDNEIVRP